MSITNSLPEQMQTHILETLKIGLGIEDLLVARIVLAGLLVLMAVFLFLLALRILRSEKKTELGKTSLIPNHLLKTGTTIEVYNSDETPALRCVLTRAGRKRLRCDIIEKLGKLSAQKGDALLCLHAPIKAAGKQLNAFPCRLVENSSSKSQHVILSTPTQFHFVKRREHGRKRVVDQQFIRIKLWLACADSTDISFLDAAPDIGINSYAQDASGHNANSVLNISKGGIGLRVTNSALPTTCSTASTVVINIFMFSFHEKIFKPYWYEGTIRSMKSDGEGYTRIGISFDRQGIPDEENINLKWQ